MVPSIARQSVIMKCNMQSAYILGNYEFYYAAGLAGKLFGFQVPKDLQPAELFEFIEKEITQVTPKEEKEAFLVSRLKEYAPTENYDEQMKELLLMGETENFLWQISI